MPWKTFGTSSVFRRLPITPASRPIRFATGKTLARSPLTDIRYSTRKLNDPKWQGQPYQKLTLEVQAEKENKLVIILTENFFRSYRGESQEFAVVVKLNDGTPETISLTPDDFTTKTGEKLSSWNNVDLPSLRAYFEKDGTLLGSKSWQGPQPRFRKLYWQAEER